MFTKKIVGRLKKREREKEEIYTRMRKFGIYGTPSERSEEELDSLINHVPLWGVTQPEWND